MCYYHGIVGFWYSGLAELYTRIPVGLFLISKMGKDEIRGGISVMPTNGHSELSDDSLNLYLPMGYLFRERRLRRCPGNIRNHLYLDIVK